MAIIFFDHECIMDTAIAKHEYRSTGEGIHKIGIDIKFRNVHLGAWDFEECVEL
jgi:hypothetical protein